MGVISRVISRITRVITHIRGLITQLITAHEPPSRALRVWIFAEWGLLGLGRVLKLRVLVAEFGDSACIPMP